MAFVLKPNPNSKYFLKTIENKIISSRSFTYALTGSIGGFNQPTGIAWDPDVTKNRFFVTSTNGIKVVSSTSLAIINNIGSGIIFVGIVKDPSQTSNKMYVAANDGIYVLNTNLLTLTKIITAVNCRFITVDTDLSRDRILYTQAGRVFVIKRSDYSQISNYALASATINVIDTEGIAFDPISVNNRFLLVCRFDKVCKLIDASNFTVIRQSSSFTGEPIDILFDELDQFSSFLITDVYNGSFVRSLTTSSFEAIKSLSGFNVPVSMELDPTLTNNRYFVTNFTGNTISIMSRINS